MNYKLLLLIMYAYYAYCDIIPNIGIVIQTIPPNIKDILSKEWYCNKYQGYISSSYVRAIEGSGATVTPIFLNQNNDYYEKMVNNINGLLIPGGSSILSKKYKFYNTVINLLKLIKENNVKIPVMGICLGFELMMMTETNDSNIRVKCKSTRINLPINLLINTNKTKIFNNITDYTESLMYHSHKYCIPFSKKKIIEDKGWRIISHNTVAGLKFISMVEHKNLPYYGIQFHPEKNIYEVLNKNVKRTQKNTYISRWIYDHFISEARKNDNQNTNNAILIGNFREVPVGYYDNRSVYTSIYVFENNPNYILP